MAETTKQQAELKSARYKSKTDSQRSSSDVRPVDHLLTLHPQGATLHRNVRRRLGRMQIQSKNMAAFLRHGVFKTGQLISPEYVLLRSYATKAEKKRGIDRKVGPKIDSTARSLAAKGFLRPQKAYVPPEDVDNKLKDIFQSVLGSTSDSTKLTDLNQKFSIFCKCEDVLGHSIPNSLLHHFETLGDVKVFYKTPVDTTTPLDKMRHMDLPENLHVQFEYHRFHPQTDSAFNGVTAFPESSTIVTGLKYKDKYPGYKFTK